MRKVRATLVAMAIVALIPASAGGQDVPGPTGKFDRPREGFAAANTLLRDGPPEQVGLDPAPIRAADGKIAKWTTVDPATGHPLFAGAVSLLAHDGVIVHRSQHGQALRYADANGTELPAGQQVPMRPDTIFDMASISKLFTSITVMQLIEQGKVDVDAPVAKYLPEFGVNGKEAITVKQLLTHVSGLEPFLPLWRDWPDVPSRIKAVMDVAPKSVPGTTYVYSDLNLITLGVLVERITGSTLDTAVRTKITEPLGMRDTGYNPPPSKLDRIAATEFQSNPPRGMVRGSVHDENAWSLGGVAGHAGVFSTARDMATLAQTILNGGSYAGQRILGQDAVTAMLTNHNQNFPDNSHGLGFELDQRWYMGGLAGPRTAGHTGFTGTSLVIDPASRSFAILLTNRVHPTRGWGSINLARETIATGLANALSVTPKRGYNAHYTGIGDQSTATLDTVALTPRGGPVGVRFQAFVDTENTDQLVLESSVDGVTFTPVPVRASGPGAPDGDVPALAGAGHRRWWSVSAEVAEALPEGTSITFRWRFTTDRRYTGRGVYVDGIKVTDGSGTLLDGEKEPVLLRPRGWETRTR